MTERVCVFGASGATGTIVTRQAVERGLDVVAFVRSVATSERLAPDAIAVGDVRDLFDVERAMTGCDGVVCVLGPRASSPEVFCAEATRNIIAAMKSQGVKRLVCVTGAMVGDYPHLAWFMRSMKASWDKKHPDLARDRAEQEQAVVASGLDWTVVKPPRLTDGVERGRVRSGEDLKVASTSSVSRADLSRFILDQLNAREYVCKRVVVEY